MPVDPASVGVEGSATIPPSPEIMNKRKKFDKKKKQDKSKK